VEKMVFKFLVFGFGFVKTQKTSKVHFFVFKMFLGIIFGINFALKLYVGYYFCIII